MPLRALAAAAALLLALSAAQTQAQAQDCAPVPPQDPVAAAEGRSLPPDILRPHRLALAGRCLAFQSLAGSLAVPGEDGKPRAEITYVAYTLTGADTASRPIVFALNGGPGAGSVWLQLGALSPWRLPMQGLKPSSAPALVANDDTWLDFADLVFLDPPGTGYSQPHDPGAAEKAGVWAVNGDIDVLSDAIRQWLTQHGRLGSPKFIVGESYGGFRAPKLAHVLTKDGGVGIAGIILLSPVLDFGPFVSGPDNPFPYLTRLPSYAAAAREEKGPVTRADLADVEAYARGEYLSDWLSGPRDPGAVERRTARVAALTGLPPDVVRRYGGDLDEQDFLRERGQLKGRQFAFYDATLSAGATGPDWPDAEDPILPGFVPALTGAMTKLYQEQLGWKVGALYETLNGTVSGHWGWGRGLRPPDALSDLAQQLALDPDFRVLVAHGLTDVQAPYFASVLQLQRLPPFTRPDRLQVSVFPGGHMFYMRDESRKAFREQARRLIEAR